MYTKAWSAIVAGSVMKKKARVMWKSERDVMIVLAEMKGILAILWWFPAVVSKGGAGAGVEIVWRRRGQLEVAWDEMLAMKIRRVLSGLLRVSCEAYRSAASDLSAASEQGAASATFRRFAAKGKLPT